MRQLLGLIFAILASAAQSEDKLLGIDVPNGRQLYVSCYLLGNNLFLNDTNAMEEPNTCMLMMLRLIIHREGGGTEK